jgi:hypothetical protein
MRSNIVALSIGNYHGPILDEHGNRYSGANWICNVMRFGNTIPRIGIVPILTIFGGFIIRGFGFVLYKNKI